MVLLLQEGSYIRDYRAEDKGDLAILISFCICIIHA